MALPATAQLLTGKAQVMADPAAVLADSGYVASMREVDELIVPVAVYAQRIAK
jgi:hypothetical protein